ncbi:glycosyltransferase family 4 protein [Mucilaginibacter paludis]|uniref:Glycosyl transferase group 1 n=1 Tax=Mucilaginibacter paludis DSM 18603 TaxID=714943 RepID=H1Y0J0_9SPHI|nr:glycosyltransferase family 4 protein [Mucilaginibacter paludis]EHQ28457.1 glycosyl transferase group 1 [Mucilaginibacter paludis DSM 18603]
MKIVYTAPNKSHHYKYAKSMYDAGVLKAFVSGFSRFSPRAAFPEIGDKLYRADKLQTIYLAALKFGLPDKITSELAFLAKGEQDRACKRFVRDSDVFLFYNGCGLKTCNYARKHGSICVVEGVNSHVSYQEKILSDEYSSLGLHWEPFHQREKSKRLKEYDAADYILVPSDFVRNSFLEYGFPFEKIIKVPYGFNSFPNQDQLPDSDTSDDFTILYVGSVSVRKGLRYLLKAFDNFEHPKKKLVIVGPDVAGENGIRDLKIPENVVFTGALKGEELENAYKSANVFCLPSIEEGLALVLGEALSFGIPIVATINTGATDIISDGVEGFIVPIRDPLSISEKFQQLADDKELYFNVKQNAVKKAKGLKGWDVAGDLLVSSLEKVVEENRQKG